MKHGTYVGSNPQLWGEKALIRKKWNIVLVQFDNINQLPLSLTHRWVPFNKTDFIYDQVDIDPQNHPINVIIDYLGV